MSDKNCTKRIVMLLLIIALPILSIWMIRIWIPNQFSHSRFYSEELAKERKALYEETVSECLKKFGIVHFDVICGYIYTTEFEEWVEIYLYSSIDKHKLKEIGDELCTMIDDIRKDNSDIIESFPCVSVHVSDMENTTELYYYLRDFSSKKGIFLKEEVSR